MYSFLWKSMQEKNTKCINGFPDFICDLISEKLIHLLKSLTKIQSLLVVVFFQMCFFDVITWLWWFFWIIFFKFFFLFLLSCKRRTRSRSSWVVIIIKRSMVEICSSRLEVTVCNFLQYQTWCCWWCWCWCWCCWWCCWGVRDQVSTLLSVTKPVPPPDFTERGPILFFNKLFQAGLLSFSFWKRELIIEEKKLFSKAF